MARWPPQNRCSRSPRGGIPGPGDKARRTWDCACAARPAPGRSPRPLAVRPARISGLLRLSAVSVMALCETVGCGSSLVWPRVLLFGDSITQVPPLSPVLSTDPGSALTKPGLGRPRRRPPEGRGPGFTADSRLLSSRGTPVSPSRHKVVEAISPQLRRRGRFHKACSLQQRPQKSVVYQTPPASLRNTLAGVPGSSCSWLRDKGA